jgi:hypothetical protein
MQKKYKEDDIDENIISNKFKIQSNCPVKIRTVSPELKLIYSGGFKEIIFSNENYNCTFDILLTLVNNYIKEQSTSIEEIKKLLQEEYNKLYKISPDGILNIIDTYTKNNERELVKSGVLSLYDLITDKDYEVNIVDIILVANYYKIPVVLISKSKFNETNSMYMTFNVSDKAYFIVTPRLYKTNRIAKYGLLLKDNEALINLSNIQNEPSRIKIQNSNEDIDNIISYYSSLKSGKNETLQKTKKIKKTLILK